jgi:hypothetical protein
MMEKVLPVILNQYKPIQTRNNTLRKVINTIFVQCKVFKATFENLLLMDDTETPGDDTEADSTSNLP